MCTGYHVSDDPELPNRLCNECEGNLIANHNFRLNVESVEEKLAAHRIKLEPVFDPVVEELEDIIDFHEQQLVAEEQEDVEMENSERELLVEVDEQTNEESADEQVVLAASSVPATEVPRKRSRLSENTSRMLFKNLAAPKADELSQIRFVLPTRANSAVALASLQTEVEKDDDSTASFSEEPVCRFESSSFRTSWIECIMHTTCKNGNLINRKSLDTHLSKISGLALQAIRCSLCDDLFEDRRSFAKHYKDTHGVNVPTTYPCKICDVVLSTWPRFMNHLREEHSSDLKFQCALCQMKFLRSDHCKEHEKNCRKKYEDSVNYFTCPICAIIFYREETFKKHKETAHLGENPAPVSFFEHLRKRPTEDEEEEADERDQERITCTTCNKTFKNEQSLNKHISLLHSNQAWSCEKCDAVFVHRSTKISHMSKIHGAPKPFECTYADCNFSCFKRDRFQAHIDKHEDPNKKFHCPICQEEFKSYNTMTIHRAKHRSQSIYSCDNCPKQFLEKRNFDLHSKLHTGKGLFHCPVCQKGFNRKEHLTKHQISKQHVEEGVELIL